MMVVFMVICAMGCWACIICSAVWYGWVAAGLILVAALLQAIISAGLDKQTKKEYCKECAEAEEEYQDLLDRYNELKGDFNDLLKEYKDLRRDFMEDDRK